MAGAQGRLPVHHTRAEPQPHPAVSHGRSSPTVVELVDLVRGVAIEQAAARTLFGAVVLEHAVVYPGILALDAEHSLGLLSLDYLPVSAVHHGVTPAQDANSLQSSWQHPTTEEAPRDVGEHLICLTPLSRLPAAQMLPNKWDRHLLEQTATTTLRLRVEPSLSGQPTEGQDSSSTSLLGSSSTFCAHGEGLLDTAVRVVGRGWAATLRRKEWVSDSTHEVIVTVGAELVCILHLARILPERLLALVSAKFQCSRVGRRRDVGEGGRKEGVK